MDKRWPNNRPFFFFLSFFESFCIVDEFPELFGPFQHARQANYGGRDGTHNSLAFEFK